MALMDFFRRKSSGDVAKDRLKLLLISDRANCSPEVMELIKNDIIKVISRRSPTAPTAVCLRSARIFRSRI